MSKIIEPSAEPPGFTVRQVEQLVDAHALHLPIREKDGRPNPGGPLYTGPLYYRCHLCVMVPGGGRFDYNTGRWNTHRAEWETVYVHQDLTEIRHGEPEPAESIHHTLLETLWGQPIEK